MSEIKTPLFRGSEGEPYTFGSDDYIITEEHTLSDILRFCVEQCGLDEVKYIVDEMIKEKPND